MWSQPSTSPGFLPIPCFYFPKLPDILPTSSYLPKLRRIGFYCWQLMSSDLQVVLCYNHVSSSSFFFFSLTMCFSSSVACLLDVYILCLPFPDRGLSGGLEEYKTQNSWSIDTGSFPRLWSIFQFTGPNCLPDNSQQVEMLCL